MSVLTKHLRGHVMPFGTPKCSLPQCTQTFLGRYHVAPRGVHGFKWQQQQHSLAVHSLAGNGTALAGPHASVTQQGVKTDAGRILDTALQDEVQKSYLAYAMSVIVGRALPDVRDGLKPVHRRILYAMHELGLAPNRPFRKSARVVGEVLGKYHPHGDTAVYDALVRLAQPFSMRMPLVNGHGNFGSQDDDPAAAMRYTECRLQQASSSAFLTDLEYDTVEFSDTFDGSQQEPTVLPARLPNLLINGSQGIAVGMATNIPPHNVSEVVSGLEALIKNPDISIAELMTHIPGPDFPTGGEILAAEGSIQDAYSTGRGPIVLRGKSFIEDDESQPKKGSKLVASGKTIIVISELPFQTVKSRLVAHIAELVNQGTLPGISDIRDESDRDGMRIVVEVKKGFAAEVVLNNLHRHTSLQKRFSCNLVALVNGTPLPLSLKEFLSHFLEFRCEVVRRRAQFKLQGAEKRRHVVEGLIIAQRNMDKVVSTIRSTSDSAAAAQKLQQDFFLSPEQADAVLSMTLRRLTALEAGKMEEEGKNLQSSIRELKDLLGSNEAIRSTVAREAREIADNLGNPRRTLVLRGPDGEVRDEDLIPNRLSLIVYSSRGYIKRMAPDHFAVQGRGGKGMKGAGLRENDSVEQVQQVSDHDHILFFTSDGKAFGLKAYQIPEASRTAAGISFSQLLNIAKDQKVAAMLPVGDFESQSSLLMLTKKGWMKQVAVKQFKGAMKKAGLTAMALASGDEVTTVKPCQPGEDVILGYCDGCVARSSVDLFRPMGRTARGLQATKGGAEILGIATLAAQGESSDDPSDEEGEELLPDEPAGPYLLFISDQGHGKLTPVNLFRSYVNRRSSGVMGMNLPAGAQLAAFQMLSHKDGDHDALISTAKGIVTRISLKTIPILGRKAKGVILMRLQEDDRISGVTVLDASTD